MVTQNKIPIIIDIPKEEALAFDTHIREYRNKYISSSDKIVELVFNTNKKEYLELINSKKASEFINVLRESAWQEFLKEEVEFNAKLMRDLHKLIHTPREILNILVNNNIVEKQGDELFESIKELCGEYAGRIFPYLYKLSLSNTQSRRSRAGKTFEAIIYKVYDLLDYKFDSQGKVGRKIFDEVGLGKKVDSILPGINEFNKRRNKTIIGTMKTSLRERWQEVAEEIERTKIPEIHLLTADEDISSSKASEMSKHNIVVVTFDWVSDSIKLKSSKNIISFEEYLFDEIPAIFEYWK
ncbi:type II restriction endonuclease [Mariniflexile soesokkakense]|uniref:Type II restriction endonuclease n=1 Tax=Mariniflexile soesokkakense TaxID=1343160 RepID=A0ABV0A9H9_9FLAO